MLNWNVQRRFCPVLTCADDMRSRNLYKKPARKIWRKFITGSCSKTTLQPITLHGSCHMLESFCAGIKLCSIVCKKLVPEKTCRLPDWLTHVQVSGARRLAQVTGTSFLKSVSPALDTCTVDKITDALCSKISLQLLVTHLWHWRLSRVTFTDAAWRHIIVVWRRSIMTSYCDVIPRLFLYRVGPAVVS